MNREIKFRACDKQEKKMYLPYLGGKITLDMNNFTFNCRFELQQFTGLLDKNGKEIYEGDIVKFRKHQSKDSKIRIGQIYFADGDIAQYRIKWFEDDFEKEKNYPSTTSLNLREIEIIGNIFENPELIK